MKSVADNFLEIRGIGYSNYNGRFAPYLSTHTGHTGIPGLWTQELDAGLWTWALDSGRWTLDAGLWILDSGPWTLNATLRKLGSGH